MHLVIVFWGTGFKKFATPDSSAYEKNTISMGILHRYLNDGVGILVLNGCQEATTGNSSIKPDFTHLFTLLQELLNYPLKLQNEHLKHILKTGLAAWFPPKDSESLINVDYLTLLGISRGGVAALLFAKHLHAHSPTLGISLCVNQPVSGDRTFSGLAKECADLQQCTNIKAARVLIGAYDSRDQGQGYAEKPTSQTGIFQSIKLKVQSAATHHLADKLFTQVCPSFSLSTHTETFLLPIPSHWSPLGEMSEYYINDFLINIARSQSLPCIYQDRGSYPLDTEILNFYQAINDPKKKYGNGSTLLSC